MKEPIVRYLKFVKKVVAVVCVLLAAAIFVSIGFAFSGYIGFMIVTPVLMAAFLTVYGIYAVKFSLNLVLGVEYGKQTLTIRTKRKAFSYGFGACEDVKEKENKYVCTFGTQDSVDKFTFLKRVPFMKPYETCFTEEDIERFAPAFQGREGE